MVAAGMGVATMRFWNIKIVFDAITENKVYNTRAFCRHSRLCFSHVGRFRARSGQL